MNKLRMHLEKELELANECLHETEKALIMHGGGMTSESLPLKKRKAFYLELIEELEGQLKQIDDSDEHFTPQKEIHKSTVVEKNLTELLTTLRALKDTANQIREFVAKNQDNDPNLCEKIPYLYAEVSYHMIQFLTGVGFDTTQVSESIMKFATAPPEEIKVFRTETNPGLFFIHMTLRHYEVLHNS